MDDLSKRIDAARLPISALIFEKAMIETAELAGDVPSVPAELAPHVRPEIFALAKKVETLNREEQKLKTDRDEELKLVRRLEQNIIAFTRQGRRQAAAAAVRQRNAAQQRADAFSRQIATAANDIADGRARLKVYGTEVALRLGRLQQESNENQAHLDSIEKVHDQLISERVRSSPGYQRVSSGFIGSIESLGRLWKSSATARAAMIGIVLLIAVLDLMPLLMKAATKLPAYALRIATDSQRAFAHEAAATLSSDIQFMRLMNQIETELDDIRKVEHDRSSDWYRNYPPMIWVRLTAALSLFRKRKASSNAKPVSGNVTGQAA
jgi:hypothetical protein